MAHRPGAATQRPPKHPGPDGLSVPKPGAGSYVERFKIQRERIRILHEGNREKTQFHLTTDKSLPRLPAYSIKRETTAVQKFVRSNTVDGFKLPGVGIIASTQAIKKKEPIAVKTFHIKLNPEHTSAISKSMPSLPSIPGSPPSEILSPVSTRTALPASHRKHRFTKISVQKKIHIEKDSETTPRSGKNTDLQSKTGHIESVYNNILPQRSIRHRLAVSEPDKDTYDSDTFSLKSFTRSRRSQRMSRETTTISDTKSEGGYVQYKKWKDDCGCLRCQMLKRHYKEGDELYNLWGQYPCHRMDYSTGLEDD